MPHAAETGDTPVVESVLTRYWIEFDWPQPDGVATTVFGPHGFGVTAFDLDDALGLIRTEFFDRIENAGRAKPEPPVRSVVEDVDVSLLSDHVRPNMYPPNWRGVWYPKLRPLS